jgi:hypothetical protein
MSCDHDCDRPPLFPATVFNRPGLKRFAYRIGDYASMRAHMLDQLVKAPALAGWTHLKSDEPGIALLEGAAIVGDVLTFYQELYANETKLATAAWEDSVFDMVRLTGYRPAPGLGGHARFALELRDSEPVTVPAGFAFQAMLEGSDKPAVFESSQALEAWPALGTFHLYRTRAGLAPIAAGTTALDIVQLGNATDLATRAEHGIESGDRVLLFSGPFDPHEIVVVRETEEHLDRVTLHLEGALQQSHPAEVTAYRLGRTFRHYGADLPREFFTFREDPPKTFSHDTDFFRPTALSSADRSYYTGVSPREMPLANEVDDLAVGSTLVCTGRTVLPTGRDFVFVRRAQQITPRDILWGNVTSPVSVVSLNAELRNITLANLVTIDPGVLQGFESSLNIDSQALGLAAQKSSPVSPAGKSISKSLTTSASISSPAETLAGGALGHATAELFDGSFAQVTGPLFPAFPIIINIIETHDIRRLRLHEARGERMRLRAPPVQRASVADGKVSFFGTRDEAEALAGRTILLQGLTDAPEEIVVASDQPELAATPPGPAGDLRMWPIALGTVPKSGDAGFSEVNPAVTVHGNAIQATQGESQREAPIGSGDARLAFQTFAVPKSPLTFLSDSARTPPYAPELDIRVEGRLWTRVDTLFGQAADAEVYVVRSDGADGHVVQFGDGSTGTRLPSGRHNVTAAWRVGSGAVGELATEQSPKAKDRLKPLSKVLMPGPVTGGAAPETMGGAREAAPGRMQSLGRLVGLSDYEAEALAVPGVVKVGAVFAAQAERPLISLTVLTEDESSEAVAAVEAALRHADRCRGPSRHPLEVVAGRRRYVHLSLLLDYDPAYRKADIDAAVVAALGALPQNADDASDSGLFALPQRRFGQDVHLSQAVGAAQAVTGVLWVKPVAFAKLAATSDDPDGIDVPTNPALLSRLTALPSEVLALSELHLTLSSTTVTSDQECTV